MYRKRLLLAGFLFLLIALAMSVLKKPTEVLLTTDLGLIRLRLYDDTPIHRDNFIKLIKAGYYDDQLIHSVIRDLVIQAGDPDSKNAAQGAALGKGGPGYTLTPEIKHLHLRGALGARLEGDNNPGKLSNGSQFFIVQGRAQTAESLDQAEKQLSDKISPETRKLYLQKGGAPQLDGQFTVFGEVIQGIEVVDRIAGVARDDAGRPMRDIKIKLKIAE
jgi:cyclophilin family peptidyl-prolyl cis-trans isomerase